MKKTVLSAAVMVTWSMLPGTFACGFNHEANREGSINVANCSGSGCTFDPPQDPFAPTIERTPPDSAQACGAAYFDPDIYTGTNGLLLADGESRRAKPVSTRRRLCSITNGCQCAVDRWG
jgi:hypothetical protein